MPIVISLLWVLFAIFIAKKGYKYWLKVQTDMDTENKEDLILESTKREERVKNFVSAHGSKVNTKHADKFLKGENKMQAKHSRIIKKLTTIGVVIICLIGLFGAGQIIETNNKGQFQVKQAAVTGDLSVRTAPGMYAQMFGDITTWNKNGTFFFTADAEEGESHDESIEVRFVDGSIARISGTMRISLPRTEAEIVHLVDELGFTSYDALEAKLIKPTVRNALRLTANFMTARESYAEKRADYNTWAWDQIQNGLYKTTDTVREILDPSSGNMVKKTFKTVLKDKNGIPVYTKNPLAGTGILLSNFEVKSFVYSQTVKAQIADQQKLYMSIATAKAEAAKAQQDKIKEKAQGEAREAKAEADANVLKMTAVVEAEKAKRVAELAAEKKFEVAKFAAKTALEEAKRVRAVGMAKAAANQALVKAGLTPLEAAQIKKQTMIGMMEQWAKRPVPSSIISTGGGGGSSTVMDIMGVEAAKKLINGMNKQLK